MDKKTLFGHQIWMESIVNYKGVLKRSVYHSGGKNRSSYTEYILDLSHSDKKRIINLYRSRSRGGFREKWEDCCKALNVSAAEYSEGKLYKRSVEEFDKSIIDLIRKNKIEQVVIRRSADNNNSSPTLLIETDTDNSRFGYGFSKKELFWLKNMILNTVSQIV